MPVPSCHHLMERLQTNNGSWTQEVKWRMLRVKPSMIGWSRWFWIFKMMICMIKSGSLKGSKRREWSMVSWNNVSSLPVLNLYQTQGPRKAASFGPDVASKICIESVTSWALACNAKSVKTHQFQNHLVKGPTRRKECNGHYNHTPDLGNMWYVGELWDSVAGAAIIDTKVLDW